MSEPRFEAYFAIQDRETGLAMLVNPQWMGMRDIVFMAAQMNEDPEVAKRFTWEPATTPRRLG